MEGFSAAIPMRNPEIMLAQKDENIKTLNDAICAADGISAA